MRRYRAKVDGNHAAIRDGLRQLGFIVRDTSKVGNDFPDLIVRHPSKPEIGIRFVEIKDRTGKLTEGQIRFREEWSDAVIEARSIDDVLSYFNLI